jgi:hypothetical protein
MTIGIAVLGCLTLLLLASLIMLCVQCIKLEKSIFDITDLVERRVFELYDVKN